MDIQTLLYPLGYIATFCFGVRFFFQWLASEYEKKSVVPLFFWRISIIGNLALLIHSLIQQQYHVCVVQVCNAIISWRNVDLLTNRKKYSFSSVVKLMIFSIFLITFIFLAQYYFLDNKSIAWFKVPNQKVTFENSVPLYVHIFGFAGIVLFASRFWIQWIWAEWYHQSYLGPLFWYLSLAGNFSSLAYFLYINDTVNYLGPLIGSIPYIRNLILINRLKKEVYEV